MSLLSNWSRGGNTGSDLAGFLFPPKLESKAAFYCYHWKYTGVAGRRESGFEGLGV